MMGDEGNSAGSEDHIDHEAYSKSHGLDRQIRGSDLVETNPEAMVQLGFRYMIQGRLGSMTVDALRAQLSKKNVTTLHIPELDAEKLEE